MRFDSDAGRPNAGTLREADANERPLNTRTDFLMSRKSVLVVRGGGGEWTPHRGVRIRW